MEIFNKEKREERKTRRKNWKEYKQNKKLIVLPETEDIRTILLEKMELFGKE